MVYLFVRLNPALASWLNLSGIFAGPSGHAQIKIPNEFSAEALSRRINIPATFERAFIPPIRCWICPSRCRKISPCNTALASAPCVVCGIEGIRRIFGVQSSPCSPLPRLMAPGQFTVLINQCYRYAIHFGCTQSSLRPRIHCSTACRSASLRTPVCATGCIVVPFNGGETGVDETS